MENSWENGTEMKSWRNNTDNLVEARRDVGNDFMFEEKDD